MEFIYANEPCPPNDLNDLIIENKEWPPKMYVPDKFRCHVCQRIRPRAKYGGHLADMPVCQSCLPYVDEQDVGYLTKVDGYHRLAGPSGSVTQLWRPEKKRTPEWESYVLDWWNDEYVPNNLGRRGPLKKI